MMLGHPRKRRLLRRLAHWARSRQWVQADGMARLLSPGEHTALRPDDLSQRSVTGNQL